LITGHKPSLCLCPATVRCVETEKTERKTGEEDKKQMNKRVISYEAREEDWKKTKSVSAGRF